MHRKKKSSRPSNRRTRADPGVVCGSCGASAPAGQRFCGSCGAKLAQHCPACGAENPLTNQFCGECGTRLESPAGVTSVPAGKKEGPPAPLREERRWATLLFADLSGFTTLSERLDPEDVKTLAHRCTERLGQEVKRFGGTVITIAGDQVVAAFGAPIAHGDDAERAVRAALAMRDCQLHDGNGRAIKIHAGVNTGEVMAGLIGPMEHQDYAVMGDTTNVAARLMSAAPTGSVLVGEETWRATRGVIKYRELPPIQFKGKTQPSPVWEALEVLAAPKSRPLGTAPLVGRNEELGVLQAIWQRVQREARPHLVSVVGDPGLGKTRLVSEFERKFCGEATTLHGRCLPYGEVMSYWAFAMLLKEGAGITAEMGSDTARLKLGELVKQAFEPAGRGELDEGDIAEMARRVVVSGPPDK